MIFVQFRVKKSITMTSNPNDDWELAKNITYAVVEEQIGRGRAYDEIVAKTLGVKGLYMVNIP